MAHYYFDSSAIAKLFLVSEIGAAELLRLHAGGDMWYTSDLCRTEAARAFARADAPPDTLAKVLTGIGVIEPTRDTYDLAGRLQPARLRSLDAIHVAAALSLGPELTAVVTYDARMAEAARLNGLTVLSPGVDAL